MWSETLGYRDYRQPYLPHFFSGVADTIGLTGKEDLLDLGAGVGEVTLGFAPYVGSLTAMDLEQPMLNELGRRAVALGRKIRLIQARVEEAPLDLGPFQLITIGNAHWFMHKPGTFLRLERWLAPGGHILVGMPFNNPLGRKWPQVFAETRAKWAKDDRSKVRPTIAQFFQGTVFAAAKHIAARGERKVELEYLLLRAQGYSGTSPAMLGKVDTERMLADLRGALAPYFRNGPVMEALETRGDLYRRRGDA